MPKIIIDGKEIEFKQGQTIIEAAKDHGIEIPHFCWHPKLSVSGNCRMCLVEVEKCLSWLLLVQLLPRKEWLFTLSHQKQLQQETQLWNFSYQSSS